MRKHLCSVAGMGVLLLAGCNSPKDANKSIFKAALQQWFDANPVCAPLTQDQDLPIERAKDDSRNKAALDAAVAAGLLSIETMRSGPVGPPAAGNLTYRPTATGKGTFRQRNHFLGGVDICFARRRIETIESFTEPADMLGVRATRVTFTYTLKDIAPWATQPALAAALPAIGQILANPSQTDAVGLVLTNEGWKDEHAPH